MRILLQRVSEARVEVDGSVVGAIGPGLLALVGFTHGDDEAICRSAIEKLLNIRIFGDDEGQMNRSLLDVSGDVLAVSQFTLYADARKGRRPSYTGAMPPAEASALYDRFMELLRAAHGGKTAGGVFGAHMNVSLVNDGPVTIWIDSAEMPWGRGPLSAK